MIDLKEVLAEWATDNQIHETHLDESSRKTPILHSKYLEKLANAKLLLKKAEFSQKTLLKEKWLYYNGKMDKEQIENLTDIVDTIKWRHQTISNIIKWKQFQSGN